jgi:hypothetical protein
MVALSIVALGISSISGSGGSAGHTEFATDSTVSLQEYGTISGSSSYTQYFWQNGSPTYDTGSTKLSIPFDAGGLPTSSTFGGTLSFVYSFPGVITPLVNITQGTPCTIGLTCWNVTVPYKFSVSPSVSTVPVVAKIPAAFTASGSSPSNGQYDVPVTVQSSVEFSLLSSASWGITNGTTESTSYVISVPAGYDLNSTEVFVPWPGNVSVTANTLNVTLGGSSVSSVQVTSGGFYVVISGISSSETLRAHVAVTGTSIGGWTKVPLGSAYLDGNGQQYRVNASWINTAKYPFAGGFLLTTNYTYAINPLAINVSVNGKALNASSFFLAGTIIEILPGSLNVAGGSVSVFVVKFYFLAAPPIYTASLTTPAFGTITVGDILISLLVVLAIGIVAGAFVRKGSSVIWSVRMQSDAWWSAVFIFLFVAGVFVFLGFTGGGW